MAAMFLTKVTGQKKEREKNRTRLLAFRATNDGRFFASRIETHHQLSSQVGGQANKYAWECWETLHTVCKTYGLIMYTYTFLYVCHCVFVG